MELPTVHINGTSKDALFNGYRDAMRAVNEAINAVAATGPHGRDYYVTSPRAILTAMAEHQTRLSMLHAVSDELQALAIHVQNQG